MTLDEFARMLEDKNPLLREAYKFPYLTTLSFKDFATHWMNCNDCSSNFTNALCLHGLLLLSKLREEYEQQFGKV